MAGDNRGFASMDEDKRRAVSSKGGQSSSGNFANDPKRAREAGRKGAEAQPKEAKRRGGERSRRNR